MTVEIHPEAEWTAASMGAEIRAGLDQRPRRLPCKYFYDERGSELFERITTLPEYYLTRAEEALLARRAAEIARETGPEELIEIGSGSSSKTRLLIDATAATLKRYVPVDLAREPTIRAVRDLEAAYPKLAIHAVIGDFKRRLSNVADGPRRLVAFLGSTVGNCDEAEAAQLLREIGALLGPKDALLLGTDLIKDKATLEAAYNDAAGVTAEFNRNILRVVNRQLDGDFDLRAFNHVAFYNAAFERIESYLRSTRRQAVRLRAIDLEFEVASGELLWTEISCKYTRESVTRILDRAGLRLTHWIVDDDQRFGLSLARRV